MYFLYFLSLLPSPCHPSPCYVPFYCSPLVFSFFFCYLLTFLSLYTPSSISSSSCLFVSHSTPPSITDNIFSGSPTRKKELWNLSGILPLRTSILLSQAITILSLVCLLHKPCSLFLPSSHAMILLVILCPLPVPWPFFPFRIYLALHDHPSSLLSCLAHSPWPSLVAYAFRTDYDRCRCSLRLVYEPFTHKSTSSTH